MFLATLGQGREDYLLKQINTASGYEKRSFYYDSNPPIENTSCLTRSISKSGSLITCMNFYVFHCHELLLETYEIYFE